MNAPDRPTRWVRLRGWGGGFIDHMAALLGGVVYLIAGALVYVLEGTLWAWLGFEKESIVLLLLKIGSSAVFLLTGLARITVELIGVYAAARNEIKRRLSGE